MPTALTVALTVLAAALFAAFHVPLPTRSAGVVSFRVPAGRPARLLGVGYHLLLLPAVAALPAPVWAVAAGFAWMLADAILDGAGFVGASVETGPIREGIHLVAAVWLVAAGVTNGPLTAVTGIMLAAVFLIRFGLSGSGRAAPHSLLHVNAALNVLWIFAVAIMLALS